MEDFMKLLNNLAKMLNKQYLNTNSNNYPFFENGYLCVDSIESAPDSMYYLIIRKKNNKYTIVLTCDSTQIYYHYPFVIKQNISEKEVVTFFK